jgi:hypothetical protein
VIRLTGLPHVGRYPRASISRRSSALLVDFSGEGGSRTLEVPLERLGEGEDAEAVELRLLAELQRQGYRVERLPPRLTSD